MMLIIERFCDHHIQGCFGELYIDGEFFSYTVEQPWRNNERYVSCVPVGDYILTRYSSNAHPDAFCMVNPELNVYAHNTQTKTGRFACLIHPANFASDVHGCIGLGRHLSSMYNTVEAANRWMVTNSKETVKEFMDYYRKHDEIKLNIRWKYGDT